MKKGFSLIELAIVVAIFAIVTLQILANYKGLSSNKSLEALAQEVALSFREAQVYGIGVKGESQQFLSRGIHIDLNQNEGDKILQFFVDINKDNTFTIGEGVRNFKIKGSNYIDVICGNWKSENNSCGRPMQVIDVLFKRPNPDAVITGDRCPGSQCSDIAVVLKSIRNKERRVIIWNTGQITTE